MQELEIEKRYLTINGARLHDHFTAMEETPMKDVYIPNGEAHKDLRLRQKGDKYMITRKRPVQDGGKLVMEETTIEISKEEFDALSSGISSVVAKTRKTGSFDGIFAEVDVFEGDHAGMTIVEFEFANMKAYEAFTVSNKLNDKYIDITEDEALAGGRLAETSRDDLKKHLEDAYGAPLYAF